MPFGLGFFAAAGAGGAAAGSFDLLQTTLISSNTASVTFSNLGDYSAYRHLQIRATLRGNTNTNYDGYMRFNGVSTSSYAWHMINGFGFGINSQNGTSATSMFITSINGTNEAANIFSTAVIDIWNFNNSSRNKTIRVLGGQSGGAVRLTSGFYNSTNAITSIELGVSTGASMVSGSRISLYGIKG